MSNSQTQKAYSPDHFGFYLAVGLLMSTASIVGGVFIGDTGMMILGVIGGAYSLIMLAYERWMEHQDELADTSKQQTV